jgi:membrane-bound lytic murein transglycosylase D
MRMANWFIPCINLVMRFRRIVSSTKGEFVMQRSPFLTTARCFILACAAVFMASAATANPFPQHDVIAPNVAFWTQIYSTYATHQAVVHDDRDLSIIYDVITLKPATAIGARKTNRQRMKKARAKYRALLRQLASNPRHAGVENRRIAALFGPSATAATFSRAARQVRCQIGQKDRFKAGLVRSGAYIEEIRAIFQSYGLPEELAYLPHVESSFNISAYSKFGAAGMWQFTRSTGKRFMKVDYVLDERRDPIKATHAAARLLLDNYSKLQSWPLAITAYNHGAAGMAKAKNAHGDYAAIVTRYRSRTFKFASRNFYSEFLAAMQVASDYRSYFGEITLDRPRPSRTVELKGYADLEGLCTHFNVSRETVKALNPALRDPVFQGQKLIPKGYALRLPNTRKHRQCHSPGPVSGKTETQLFLYGSARGHRRKNCPQARCAAYRPYHGEQFESPGNHLSETDPAHPPQRWARPRSTAAARHRCGPLRESQNGSSRGPGRCRTHTRRRQPVS